MIGISLGFIWLAIVHLAPTHATYIAHIGGIIVCLIVTVFSFIVSNEYLNPYKVFSIKFIGYDSYSGDSL